MNAQNNGDGTKNTVTTNNKTKGATNKTSHSTTSDTTTIQKPNAAARRTKNIFFGLICSAILVVLFVVCMGFGRAPMSPSEILAALGNMLFGMKNDVDSSDMIVISDVRLPVMCASILVGAALSVSGSTFQGLFRNPLVSPDILGASAGAAFGAALALLMEFPNELVQAFAFIGGFLAVVITYFSAKYISKGVNQILLLVLSGLIVGTLFQSFVEAIKYVADPYSTLPEITYWLMGSLSKVTWGGIAVFMIPFVVGLVPIMIFRWRLNTLSLGDDEAKALGINVSALRGMFIFCATLLTSAVVAIAGIVGWVGLIIPHIVRFIFGPDNRIVLPMSTIIGACFMIVVSTMCNSIMASEIPLGILTAIIGAPFFYIILMKTKRNGGI